MKIRYIMNEIGRLQWVKNKSLEELRETRHRFEEEKKREKEEIIEMENKMRLKNIEIDLEK